MTIEDRAVLVTGANSGLGQTLGEEATATSWRSSKQRRPHTERRSP
jgi:NAD(P)-dependent dehydrogenase (short-subunit alcohol dehydrogenase family)